MTTMLHPETTTQFLARMILSTRENNQITSADAQRLSNMAQYGNGGPPTTMAEERRDGSKPLDQKGAKDLVTG